MNGKEKELLEELNRYRKLKTIVMQVLKEQDTESLEHLRQTLLWLLGEVDWELARRVLQQKKGSDV